MTKHRDFFTQHHVSRWRRLLFSIRFAWMDWQLLVQCYRETRPEYRAGMRFAEAQVLDDIEFGYDTTMIAQKIEHHSYSYRDPKPAAGRVDCPSCGDGLAWDESWSGTGSACKQCGYEGITRGA